MMEPSVIGNTFHGNITGRVNEGPVFNDVIIDSKTAASRKELADWVSPLDFSPLQAQALNKRTAGTLEWLIVTPQFMNWRSRRGSFLWCPGPPGAGKTVFAAFVIDQLQKVSSRDPSSVSAVCYIFCQYSKKLSVLQLFEVILKQLILSCPSVDITETQRMKDEFRRLPLDEIISILQSNFRRLPGTFVVVDALDECFSEADRHHLLQRMRAFSDVNILTTSRDLPHIAEDMQGVTRLDVRAIERDIKIHADVQRQRNPRFAKLAMRISSTDDKVIAKAAGSFLLADRHITHLSEQTTERAFINALDTLPIDAAVSHASALGRINQQNERDRCLAYTVLSLISYAFRPFKSLELRHAAANVALDRVAQDDDLADEDRIISVCAGLITINSLSTEVDFTHYTVQEYVQQIRQASDFLSQSEITKSLMRLIRSPGVTDPPRHILFNYAASTWPHHVRLCEDDESVVEMTLSLLSNSTHVEIVCSMWDPYHRAPRYDSGVQAVHLVAAFGLTQIGKLFIRQNPQCMDQQDSKGRTPLSWAAGEGHSDTVLMLLEAGNARTLPIKTAPPMPVLRRIRNKITRPVWQKVQLKDHTSQTPFSSAAQNSHLEDSNMLNITDHDGRTPLSYAAASGNLEVVKMLLNAGKVKIDAKDNGGRTQLSYAAENGQVEVVKLLLDTGKVEIDAKDQYGRTPLSYAAENGQVEVVKLLLDTGKVYINMKDTEGRTALSLGAKNGRLEVVKILLDTGKVDIDVKDQYGRTPLSYAAASGNLEVVKMLLHTGRVEIDAKDEGGQTPLFYAAENGQVEVVKMFIDIGKVNIDVKDNKGRTPLSYAAAGSHVEVVKMLLDTDLVDPNVEDEDGRTPLSYAAENGQVEVVKLLLDAGKVDIDMKDTKGRTALSLGAKNGHLEVVEVLLNARKVDGY